MEENNKKKTNTKNATKKASVSTKVKDKSNNKAKVESNKKVVKSEISNENVKKKENKTLEKIKDFLNKPAPLIIVLIAIIAFLLLFIYKNVTSSSIYVGTINKDDLQVANVHIFINNDMNYFYASNALYTGEEKEVYNYQVGYYVEDANGNYVELATRSKETDTASSLADIVEELSGWSIGEANVSDYFFTNEVLKNISNLHFVVKATTDADSTNADVYIDYEVELEKITKN